MDCYQREKTRTGYGTDGRPRVSTRRLLIFLAVAAVGLLALAATVSAGGGCSQSGKNVECSEFGKIAMDNRERVRGDPVDVNATITLNTSYEDRGARWIMFSIRNVTHDGDSPISLRLNTFSTDDGEVVTTRVVHDEPNELNLWVDVLDLPVREQIELNVTVGVTEEGAYAVETLVLAFDRGYEPIKNASGENVGLFSNTLLGVNEATGPIGASSSDSPLGIRSKVPGLTATGAVAATATVAILLSRRRER